MLKCAVLVGSAPENFRQKKLDETWDSLESEEGGFFSLPVSSPLRTESLSSCWKTC